MESQDSIFHLNFAVTLFNHGDVAEARKRFKLFEELFQAENGETPDPDSGVDPDVLEMRGLLGKMLREGGA